MPHYTSISIQLASPATSSECSDFLRIFDQASNLSIPTLGIGDAISMSEPHQYNAANVLQVFMIHSPHTLSLSLSLSLQSESILKSVFVEANYARRNKLFFRSFVSYQIHRVHTKQSSCTTGNNAAKRFTIFTQQVLKMGFPSLFFIFIFLYC